MSQKATRLLNQLDRMVRQEARQQQEQIERQWSLPLAERVRTGRAIEGLCFSSINAETGNVVLRCQSNQSRFREGDHLFLHRGNPLLEPLLECTLEIDEELHLEIVPLDLNVKRLIEEPDDWIADEAFVDMSGYYLQALTEVGDRQVGRTRILPLITDELRPGIDYNRYERGWAAATDSGLNETQAEAVGQAYATDLAHLIQGPPGTGKTIVLAHLARLLAEEGERVFVTALTHRAIDNALNKIAQVAPDLPVCKIGPPGREAGDLKVPFYGSFDQSKFWGLSEGYIIGATPFATRTGRLAEVEFDTVLFDEASQVTLPLAIMGMLVGQRYVFIGDDRQLPPVVTTFNASPLARTSIFGYLADRGYDTMLTETYRLNDVLSAWPSRTFYNNLLVPAPQAKGRRLELAVNGGRWDAVLDPGVPAVFVDLHQRNTTVRSHLEADVVVSLILALVEGGIAPEEIGVVTPYRAQGREIRNLLRRTPLDRDARREIVVDTVERMQGQEREVVLVSLATSNPIFAGDLAEFFFQPERMNVTITRPRTKLIITGSSRVLGAAPPEPELAGWVDLFRDMLQSCALQTVSYGEERPWR
ncbi:MAG: AAA family ATPase [Anaerolineae bacterium]|nr:AAA family ATPase [Anaerolineae bacterium]